jgi:N-acetylglucosaminyl-diphospho-decaprenol L-rhamnosyltransferase
MTLAVTGSVVSHGHGPLLHALLDQMAAEPVLQSLRVVVTLNVPEDFDRDRWGALDIVVLRNDQPKGFGANHNAAFAHCSTPAFAVLNPDLAIAGPEPFGLLVRRLADDPGLGIVAPVVRSPEGTVEDSVRGNLTPWSLMRRHVFGRRAVTGAGFRWLAGMCLVVSSDAFRRVGGFDERFFLYCEDYDLCARVHLAGWGVEVEPSATIVHAARRDSHASGRHLRWHLASLLKVWTSAAFWRVVLGRRHPPRTTG